MTSSTDSTAGSQVVSPQVLVVMGSQSDWPTLIKAAEILGQFEVPYDTRIVSAHRTPERLPQLAEEAEAAGVKVIIAGAGGAAHLPGMVAAHTMIPVLGVPVQSKALQGLDSLLSMVQMPAGVPVGTLAIGEAGATNAGLLAVSIMAQYDAALMQKLKAYRAKQTADIPRSPSPLSSSSLNQTVNSTTDSD